ncbi:adenylate/guanylate cyclase domain-containing protein [Janthinobacterium sp. BJB412]|nr:adenylate/guanylate cyclase domain-containing protein [Janthinobacterium sp. BJB412]
MAAVLLTAALQWLTPPSGMRFADEWLRDRFVTLAADPRPEQRILVVDIDEASLARHPWPWPRARLAELIETLLADGARGVALDILLAKPADPDGDARLAMLARHGPLVLAQLFDFAVQPAPLRGGQLVGGAAAPAGSGLAAHGYLANHAGLAQAAHAGNIGVQPDADGTLRRLPAYTWFEGRRYPTLARALFDCCAGGAPLAADYGGQMRIPYRRAWSAYRGVAAADVLEQRVAPADVKDKLVLVGSSALSIGDRLSTPLGPSTAGLLVHAAVLDTLLERQAGRAPAPWPGKWMALLFCLSVVFLISYTLPRRSAAANVGLLAVSSLLWLALAYRLVPHDPDFAPSGPLWSNLLLLAVAIPFHWQLTQHTSRQLLGTLRQYVAKEVVDELLRRDLKDPLAPTQLQVTTLIADLEGYTGHVEALPVEEAARLTTDFLDCLTRPVLEQHGTLDKYTGDGLVAFWGAPLPNPEHADLALDAARRIVQEVKRMSARRVAEGKAPLRVRIGIESGLAMAGDYGTSFRSIYTAVGDSVNTASRLEQAARDFPHDVIIGEGTVRLARRHHFIELGERLLRGKEKPIRLYALREEA